MAVVAIGVWAGLPGAAAWAASPAMSNQASASGFPAGSQIYDSVTIGNGSNPTGTVTFTLFGPNNSSCSGDPIFTSTISITGNGYYESARYTTNAAGTYRWIAAYSGDANNTAPPPTACSDTNAHVMVAKRMPTLNAVAYYSAPWATDHATLAGGSGPNGPTGTIRFRLFGPDDPTCAGSTVTTFSHMVAGNGMYPSQPTSVSVPGTYQWVVNYTGDVNNNALSTVCSDPSNRFAVAGPPRSTAVLTVSPTTVGRAGTITATWRLINGPTSSDWVALYRSGEPEGGQVTAWAWTGGGASGQVNLKFPWHATAGTYEVRLMANNTTQRLATSEAVNLVY